MKKKNKLSAYQLSWTVLIFVLIVSLIPVSQWILNDGTKNRGDQIQVILATIGTAIGITSTLNWLIDQEVKKRIKEQQEADEKNESKEPPKIPISIQYSSQVIQILQSCIELIEKEPSASDLGHLKKQLKKLKESFEDRSSKIEQRLNAADEAHQWLSHERVVRKLAREAVNEALKKHPLKDYIASDDEPEDVKHSLQRRIYEYLLWVRFCLEYKKEISTSELSAVPRAIAAKQPYEAALNFIKDSLPQYLSSGSVKEVERYVNILIEKVP